MKPDAKATGEPNPSSKTQMTTKKKKVMIAAHMDEIGFIVTHIDERGFVYFHTLGGFDPKTLTAQRVIIHGNQDVLGVMGSKPIHLMTPEDRKKTPAIKDYFIDTGMSAQELKQKISVGDSITRERKLVEMGENLNCKSLDNRISVYILVEMFKEIREIDGFLIGGASKSSKKFIDIIKNYYR